MPESFEITSNHGQYDVQVGRNLIGEKLAGQPESVIIVDERLIEVLPSVSTRIIRVAATEENKSLEKMAPIVAQLRDSGAGRDTHMVAVGGGVIQDIATFVASIYMRGISWSYFPTTFLGMVDSCIGGKSSINVIGYKNLVGNFYPPKDVIIDLDFLKTLHLDHVIGGLCEAAKICYARGYDEFEAYLAEDPSSTMSMDQAEKVAVRSLRAKKWFIETDEFDKKERLLLNFGHTFGHAIESGTGFRIIHGVAVGIGMLVAVQYSKQQGLLLPPGVMQVDGLAKHIKQLLGEVPILKDDLHSIELDRVLEKFESDKKHYSDKYRIIAPAGDGTLEIRVISRTDVCRSEIRSAFETAINNIANAH